MLNEQFDVSKGQYEKPAKELAITSMQ